MQTCEIETRLGAKYVFPDMTDKIHLPVGAGLDVGKSSITLVNTSGAALVLPFRIVKTIRLDGTVIWEGPEL